MESELGVEAEEKMKKSVGKALKQALKYIDSTPTLVIDMEECATGEDGRSLEDVREWLFTRR